MTPLLKLPEIITWTKLSRSSIYRLIALGEFPKPISLGARAVAWQQSDIENWLQQRAEQSRGELS